MTKFLAKLQIAIVVSLWLATSGASPLVVGAPPPDFVLPGLHGKNLRLSEYRADVVVLNFWAGWCARCAAALPALNTLYQQRNANGLQVLAVNVDHGQPESARIISELQAGFPILADDSANSVSKAYELGKLPLTLLIDREGNVRFIHTGFDEEISQQIEAQVDALLTE